MRTTIQRLFSASLSRTRPFTVLAIETSADDTGAAILTSNRDILSNVVVKQNALYVFLMFRETIQQHGLL